VRQTNTAHLICKQTFKLAALTRTWHSIAGHEWQQHSVKGSYTLRCSSQRHHTNTAGATTTMASTSSCVVRVSAAYKVNWQLHCAYVVPPEHSQYWLHCCCAVVHSTVVQHKQTSVYKSHQQVYMVPSMQLQQCSVQVLLKAQCRCGVC
jgi:hypothetical protein